MLKTKIIKLVFVFFWPLFIFGQKENSYWYFGGNAGVHFANGTVTAKTDGKLNSNEGCATISDTAGNLLFYTDGTYIWNKIHNRMPNGNGLKGNASSTQSAMIVRKPNSMDIYYVITVNGISGNPNTGAFYSIVDMRLDNGNGDVVSSKKNIPLQATTDEKITAVLHADGHDIWIIVPERNPIIINTYLLSDTGINLTPIKNYTNANSIQSVGYIRVSPNGKKLAMAAYYPSSVGYIMVGDFDYQTGVISNTDTVKIEKPYGIEFSPNNQYLYVSFEDRLLGLSQFDLKSSNKTALKASRYDLIKNYSGYVGSLHLGIDRKVYMAFPGRNYLGCIEKPDEAQSNCSVNLTAVDLKSFSARYGLQNCLYSLPRSIEILTQQSYINCFNQIYFSLNNYDYISNVNWNFGDTSVANILNQDTLFYSKHIYKSPSQYKVTAYIVYKDGKKDTLIKKINLSAVPKLSIKNCFFDTLYKCPKDYISIGCANSKLKYLWDNGDTAAILNTNLAGKYSVNITDSLGCLHQFSSNILEYNPSVDLGPDLKICENDSSNLKLQRTYTYKSFLWNTGAIDSIIKISPGKTYSITAIDKNNCTSSDTLNVVGKPMPKLNLGNDTSFCEGFSKQIKLNETNTQYTLNGAPIVDGFDASKTATYIVEANRESCITNDTLTITVIPFPLVNLGYDDSICMDGSFVLDAGIAQSYKWNTGSTSRFQSVYKEGTYIVNVYNAICSNSDSINMYMKNVEVFIPNAFSPNDDGNNDSYHLNEGSRLKEMLIYNLWGELIFRSDASDASWDGKYKDEICQQGVYMVMLVYWDCQHRIHYKKESVHLLR